MNKMQTAFQKYTESEDFKESLAINKFFEHPEGLAWCAFIEAWEAVEHRVHLTAFGAFLAGGFVGGLLMLIVLFGLYGGR